MPDTAQPQQPNSPLDDFLAAYIASRDLARHQANAPAQQAYAEGGAVPSANSEMPATIQFLLEQVALDQRPQQFGPPMMPFAPQIPQQMPLLGR